MPLVSKPIAFACRAERLAGARACPNSLIVSPSGPPQSKRPDPDPGEEVTLCESGKVARGDVFD
jgi:hypothetical protein